MMDFTKKLSTYAKLVTDIGVQVKEGDTIVIKCPIERADFARLLAKNSYEAGAHSVIVNWSDDDLTLMEYENSPVEVMEDIPQYLYDRNEYLYEKGAKFISVYAANPELLKNIDSEKIQRVSLAMSMKFKPLMKYTMNDINSWCVVSVPTKAWADKVLPESKDSVSDLWELIFDVTRVNLEDPVKAWKDHLQLLLDKATWLNNSNFKYLRYKASNGTDLDIELPEGHIWTAASSLNAKEEEFVPNMPTEEVFTLPKKDGVNGIVYSSKPLAYNGNVIDEFWLKFENGRVVDFDAKVGKETLSSIFEQDENARYLGEVALVPFKSPISDSNVLFFNTLFDENASCHLAFGKAYPTTLKGGDAMSEEELAAHGVNDSFIHEDFMVGTSDLSIVGIDHEGKQVNIFVDGNWA
ncbi:MAG: aminopeptidase [Tissierellia bacterium]|nr:aminopeptidase [Tissierellia bacterium]